MDVSDGKYFRTVYIAWLKYLSYSEKVIPMMLEPKLKAQTINAIVGTIIGFYNFLLLHDGMENRKWYEKL